LFQLCNDLHQICLLRHDRDALYSHEDEATITR